MRKRELPLTHIFQLLTPIPIVVTLFRDYVGLFLVVALEGCPALGRSSNKFGRRRPLILFQNYENNIPQNFFAHERHVDAVEIGDGELRNRSLSIGWIRFTQFRYRTARSNKRLSKLCSPAMGTTLRQRKSSEILLSSGLRHVLRRLES
jgi:hypothetical protein